MVFLAFWVLLESPAEVMYWTPPITMKITATKLETPMTTFKILTMTSGRVPALSLQPEAALTSSGMPSIPQMSEPLVSGASTANAGTVETIPKPNRLTMIRAASLVNLDFINLLWCYVDLVTRFGAAAVAGAGVGIADGTGDEGGNNLGEGDDDETDEGVGNHLLGFLSLAGVARGHNVGNAAVDDKDSGDEAGDADDPLNGICDHGAWIYATVATDAIFGEIGAEGDTDGV